MVKSICLVPMLIVSVLARLNTPESRRDLLGVPGFFLRTRSTTSTSKVAWRVFVKDDDPLVQDPDEDTVKAVAVTEYQDGETYLDLTKGQQYCLRAFKGTTGYGTGSTVLEVVYFDGIDDYVIIPNSRLTMSLEEPGINDMKAKCFTAEDVDDYHTSSRALCLYSSDAESDSEDSCNVLTGRHAAMLLYDVTNDDSDRLRYYGLWPDDHPEIIKAGLDNGIGSDVRYDFWGDVWSSKRYPYIYCESLNTRQYWDFVQQVDLGWKWTYWTNCASFASEVFYKVTGTDVDADDTLGFESPCELGKSIVALNSLRDGRDDNDASLPPEQTATPKTCNNQGFEEKKSTKSSKKKKDKKRAKSSKDETEIFS